jgi:hypothetical protein
MPRNCVLGDVMELLTLIEDNLQEIVTFGSILVTFFDHRVDDGSELAINIF